MEQNLEDADICSEFGTSIFVDEDNLRKIVFYPKPLLNSQLMFWKSNLVLGMPNFLHWTKKNLLNHLQKVLAFPNIEIEFPKHPMGI